MTPFSINLTPAAALVVHPRQERGTPERSRKRFLINLLEVLHHSRRAQAAWEIHRYQFLAREARDYDARRKAESQHSKHGDGAMPVDLLPESRSVKRLSSTLQMSFKLRMLMAAALAGFGILHLIGGVMMHHASSKPPIAAATPMNMAD